MGWYTKFTTIMAYNTFSPIVRNNLILCLDSVNVKSYPATGSAFYDISGYNHNISMSSVPSFTGVMNFDGVTNYGTMSYNPNFDLSSTNFTIEGYFKANTLSSVGIISKDTFGVNFDWALYILNSTTLRFYSNGNATFVDGVVSLTAGTWYHYVVTSISGTITIYCNGVQVGQGAMSVSNSSQVAITVGCLSWNNPVGFLNGSISSIRIYRYGLTAAEVATNYSSLKNRFV